MQEHFTFLCLTVFLFLRSPDFITVEERRGNNWPIDVS